MSKRITYKDELKSINPDTGKFYKRGDTREKDNRQFFCYKTPIRKKDGMLSQLWLKPDAVAKHKKDSDKRERKYREEYRANKFLVCSIRDHFQSKTSSYQISMLPIVRRKLTV